MEKCCSHRRSCSISNRSWYSLKAFSMSITIGTGVIVNGPELISELLSSALCFDQFAFKFGYETAIRCIQKRKAKNAFEESMKISRKDLMTNMVK